MKLRTLDTKWSKRVRDRDGMCVICGEHEKRLSAHHLVPRQFMRFRHTDDNGITLCVAHHIWGKFAAHKNPIWFSNWLRENKPYLFLKTSERLKYAV